MGSNHKVYQLSVPFEVKARDLEMALTRLRRFLRKKGTKHITMGEPQYRGATRK